VELGEAVVELEALVLLPLALGLAVGTGVAAGVGGVGVGGVGVGGVGVGPGFTEPLVALVLLPAESRRMLAPAKSHVG